MFLNHSKWLRIALEASKFQIIFGGLQRPPPPPAPNCLGVFRTLYILTYKPLVWLGLIVCFQQCYDLLYNFLGGGGGAKNANWSIIYRELWEVAFRDNFLSAQLGSSVNILSIPNCEIVTPYSNYGY